MSRYWHRHLHRVGPAGRLGSLLAAIFVFNLGAAAWAAVVAGSLAQDGEGAAMLGGLYAACDLTRLPAAFLLPILTLRFGARRVTLVALAGLLALPLMAIGGLGTPQMMAMFVLSALPSMAVYVGLPAFVLGTTSVGRDGWALAWLGLAGGAGGALGPWVGGWLADSYGVPPALALFVAGSALLVPIAWRAPLPAPQPWPGWATLTGRGLPWQALTVLVLASAADAGRAALVPAELVRRGLPLGEIGLLLGAGCAVAGIGFLAFGRLADHQSPARVLGAGLGVLVAGSFAAALVAHWVFAYAVSVAVLGMGASGIRLGAGVALMGWVGRDRAALAAALVESTATSGRALGAPTVGALGDAAGGAYAFGAIGLVGLLAAGLLSIVAIRLGRAAEPAPALRF